MSLGTYRRKRDFTRTVEPAGSESGTTTEGATVDRPVFVVHKHAARQLHYDVRLELDGVLKSWAVPKGPSLDPHERRLAMHVEDHPLEYGSFEGVIPKGEYGGGTVMVWDRGTWEPKGDPRAGYEKGDFKVVLHGEKLRGGFAFVRMKPRPDSDDSGDAWLMIKERDDQARPGHGDDLLEQRTESAASGRSLDEIALARDGVWHSARTGVSVAAIEGAVRRELPDALSPQLATLAAEVPGGEHWLHEVKFDGYRLLARVAAGRASLFTRHGHDWTERFAPVASAVAELPAREAWLDGEVVALLPSGVSSFGALQRALSEGRQRELVYYLFDLLYLDGYDLRQAPLAARKEALAGLVRAAPGAGRVVRVSEHWNDDGGALYEQACKLGLEGVVSKRADRAYAATRSRDWLKVKCRRRQELVVGGYTDPEGARQGFGALLVGYYEGGRLVYAGRVGTGYGEKTLAEVLRRLRPLHTDEPAFADPPRGAQARGVHWVRPELVAEVEFADWTGDGIIRHASFQALRDDKPAHDVVREAPASKGTAPSDDPPVESEAAPPGDGQKPSAAPRERAGSSAARAAVPTVAGVKITHPDKLYYPESGITKLEVACYYEAVAEHIMPHVARRPLTLVRCPDGSSRQCFFQKHADASFPKSIARVEVTEEKGTGTYFAVDSIEQLVWLVQMGGLEFHIWGAQAADYEHPDELIFDLDPDEGLPWERVAAGAELVRERLAALGLRSFVKTSGGKGVHVVAPVEPERTWDDVKAFTKAIAQGIVDERPAEYIATMSKAKRSGRIFIDYLRNGRGATSVVAFSSRRRAGAPVSMPLAWDEVAGLGGAATFTVRNAPDWLASQQKDPWQDFFTTRQSLPDLGAAGRAA
jgi:bifunctional non-homologous end joining protein LigD